jgi:hypothetical protein
VPPPPNQGQPPRANADSPGGNGTSFHIGLGYNMLMTRAQRILDEVRQLPADERLDVLQGIADLVAPPLSLEQEKGVIEAIDEADRGELVDGPAALATARGRARGAR